MRNDNPIKRIQNNAKHAAEYKIAPNCASCIHSIAGTMSGTELCFRIAPRGTEYIPVQSYGICKYWDGN